METKDEGRRYWTRACCVICLCMLVAGAVGSLVISRDRTDKQPTSAIPEASKLPPDAAKELTSFDAIGRTIRIDIHLVRGLVGLGAGAVIGVLLIAAGVLPRGRTTKLDRPRRIFSPGNVLRIVCSVLVFVTTWITCILAMIRMFEPLNDVTFSLIRNYSAIFAIVVSWVVVGRKIEVGQGIRRMVNWVMLGPFNYVPFEGLSSREHKILWISCVAVVYLLFFPPWIAFEAAMGEEGIGPPQFVGFHFLLSDQYGVLGTAPYGLAQINHRTQVLLILLILASATLAIVLLRAKRRAQPK